MKMNSTTYEFMLLKLLIILFTALLSPITDLINGSISTCFYGIYLAQSRISFISLTFFNFLAFANLSIRDLRNKVFTCNFLDQLYFVEALSSLIEVDHFFSYDTHYIRDFDHFIFDNLVNF